MKKLSFALSALTVFATIAAPVLSQTRVETRRGLALTGGTIYINPEDQPIKDGVILIRDGRIDRVGARGSLVIPRGVPILDCSGLTLTAGFYNSHVHFTRQRWANAARMPAPQLEAALKDMLLSHGFTSVFDLGSPLQNTLAIKRRINAGEVAGPRIRTTGDMLLGKGFTPPESMLKSLGLLRGEVEPEVTTEEEARIRAIKRLDGGADGLKFYAASAFSPFPVLSDDIMRAIVTEAHSRRKLVFAHPQSRDGLLAAVRNGVDILAHTTPPSGEWDKEVLDELSRKRPALIPTLKVWTVLLEDRQEQSNQWTTNNLSQLFSWLELRGDILFGTDADAGMTDFDPTIEYLLMMQGGMSFKHILAALTTTPAKRFGDGDRLGRIEKGLIADIVVFRGDPSRHIISLAAVKHTIINGKVVFTSKD